MSFSGIWNLIMIATITRERKQKRIWLNIYSLTMVTPPVTPNFLYCGQVIGLCQVYSIKLWAYSTNLAQYVNQLKHHNCRYILDPAQEHIYLLMKKDSYPRFLRSEQYINLKEMAHNQPIKKRFVVLHTHTLLVHFSSDSFFLLLWMNSQINLNMICKVKVYLNDIFSRNF